MTTHSDQRAHRIEEINWDFRGALSHYGLHRLHWYAGNFIPQIPAYLIELFSEHGELVYDPFCGIGTTLLEAVRLDRRAIGTDSNPLACEIARAKTTWFRPEDLDKLVSDFVGRLNLERRQRQLFDHGPLFDNRNVQTFDPVPLELQNLQPWFHALTFQELLLIWTLISDISGDFRRLLTVVFSSIQKHCSGQTRHWGWIADNVTPKHSIYRDAITAFEAALADAAQAQAEFLALPQVKDIDASELNSRVQIREADLLAAPAVPAESADLIVTSPPYPQATDYTRSQRLSFMWLGFDLDASRAVEVGARWKRGRRTAMADYIRDLRACIVNASNALKPGRYLCLVIGETDHTGKPGEFREIFEELVRSCGLERSEPPVQRSGTRQRLRNRRATEHAEYIMVFRKR